MDANATSSTSQQCPHRRPPTLRDRLKSMWTSVPLSRMTRCQNEAGHHGLHCDLQSQQWATPSWAMQRRAHDAEELVT